MSGRKEFFQSLGDKFDFDNLKRIQTAYWFSKNIHRPQVRDDGERYFEHPLRVAKYILKYDNNVGNSEPIVTALLHDIVEDSFTPEHVIIDLFGSNMWENLALLSKTRNVYDPITMELFSRTKKNIDDYFEDISEASYVVRLVKVCDRLDNVSDIHTFSPQRREKYVKETEQYILPIAYKTHWSIAEQIKELIHGRKQENAAVSSG